jgi:putative ABC transport system permease protein
MYLKIAFRNLLRHRKHALLNVLGLAVALAACIIIFLVIQFELSFDKHLKNYDNLYHIITKDSDANGDNWTSGVPFPVTRLLRQDYPQYKFGQLMQNFGSQVTAKQNDGAANGKKFIEENNVYFADPAILELFEVRFLTGNAGILKEVSNAAISKSMAEKYFGSIVEAMGKRINFDNAVNDFQVAAIFEDMPDASDFNFGIVASYAGFEAYNTAANWPLDDWGANTSNHQVYVQLPSNTNTTAMDQQLALFERKYNETNRDTKRQHLLNRIANIHFEERYANNSDRNVSRSSLYALTFIGLLIILMACINFINLSTALVVTRGKEVGVRKVLGSSKSQMRLQVFTETSLVVAVAIVIAIMIAGLALPYIKNMVAVQTELKLFNTGSLLFVFLTGIVTILLSGLYPSLVMSRFKPIEAIKNKINTSRVGSISLRRALVVLQFAFSQILIIATIIAINQMDFIKSVDLGFNKDAILILQGNTDSVSRARLQPFREALLQRSDVKLASFSFDAPSSENSWGSNFAFDIMEDRDFAVNIKFGDANYFKTYGLQLAAGRFYEASDTVRVYVVNETLVRKVGLKTAGEAIGKMLRLGGEEPRPVVGVVKDFKLESLREEIPPLVIFPNKRWYGITGIQLSSNNLARSREEIGKLWDKYYPEYVYNSTFFDESINKFYLQDQRLTRFYKVFALLAIFISCLGLYGLISFMVVQKTKEVGIRKVLGAGIGNILYLFSKEFTVLIAIAFLLAVPAAWYLMQVWLSDFHYRIQVSAIVFIAALLLSVIIAWITVGYKSLKAAIANPVKSLRTE